MWFRKKNSAPDSALVKTYKHYREVSNQLVSGVMRSPCMSGELLTGAAKILGILEGKKLVLHSKSEEATVMDFLFHDYRPNGKTLVERFSETVGLEKPEQCQMLDAWLQGYASCFKVKQLLPEENTLILQDLLDPEKEDIALLDLSMSRSTEPGLLMFTRIFTLPELKMSSGNTFAFLKEQEQNVLNSYTFLSKRSKVKDERTRRFMLFFSLNREYGITVRYS